MGGIKEELSFGIDLGIGSCGWAVVARTGEGVGHIIDMGSWCFDVPETDKERTPKNQIRRDNRLSRRVTRRRRQRMHAIRRLFFNHGLLKSDDAGALRIADLNPWVLRARALDERLSGVELAVALGALASRRGFKSVAKREKSNRASDDGKMLSALDKTRELLARYRTIGEMFACDPAYHGRRRNRVNCYDRTIAREDIEYEARKIFEEQSKFGNPFVSDALRDAYMEIVFFQRPLQDSEKLLGFCRFEEGEKRASKFSPTFEKFRLLSRLVNLRLREGGVERTLTREELARAVENLGEKKKVSAKDMREIMGLDHDTVFTAISADKESDDIVMRKGQSMEGTVILRKALGDVLWPQVSAKQRDDIAHCLSFFETNEMIMRKLRELGFNNDILCALEKGLEKGVFGIFGGAVDLSSKVMRKLVVHLEQGLSYDEACRCEGYEHASSLFAGRAQVVDKKQFRELAAKVTEAISNPIAKKALLEALKQIYFLVRHYGLPGSVCIELARDVGHSLEKRQEIEKGLNRVTAERKREREEIREKFGWEKDKHIGGETLLRYRLWKEQNGRCLYTDKSIPPEWLVAGNNAVQVDHILPWSRFSDDSYVNKTLCFASANQHKRNQTPYEWLGDNKESWQRFTQHVESLSIKGVKKRNYLLKNAMEREEGFRNRNLNDTRYASRVLVDAMCFFYPKGERGDKEGKRRIYTRPGALTSILRRAWGVESLKKDEAGKRKADDRHHALDALVVAAVTEGEIQRLTKSHQMCEQRGDARPIREVTPPWPTFREDAITAFKAIDGKKRVVARPERRRGRGEGHAATIRQMRERDGRQVVFERKAVTDLKSSDLERIKDPERNQHIIKAVEDWMERGRLPDDLPRTSTGTEIAKVTLRSTIKPAIDVRGGTADRGGIVRVDVFNKISKTGRNKWYLVPVYRHQVVDRKKWPWPPDRAIATKRNESEWPVMDATFHFYLSLFSHCYVEVIRSNGEIIGGYFAGVDRSTASITLKKHHDVQSLIRSIGVKTLSSIRKYAVDRRGYLFPIKSEPRLWHGEICTYPALPG